MTIFFLLMLACGSAEDGGEPAASDECTDEDGDGWCVAGWTSDSDCDDSNPRAFPGAADCECNCDIVVSAVCCDASCTDSRCF